MGQEYYRSAERFLLSFGLTLITGVINTEMISEGKDFKFVYSLN